MTTFRNIAIVGPYSSGKTTLLESLLYVSGVITRKGSISDKNTVGDAAAEARDRQMSTEVTAASLEHGGLSFNFLDCPGSVELLQETLNVLVGVDAAVVVCEPEPDRVLTLAPLFQTLDEWEIPHLVFINKMDRSHTEFNEVLAALKQVSGRPLVMHQYPIGNGETLTGFIDLVSEQAYQYHPDAAADPIPFPAELKAQEQAAHAAMLETLADFDDHLLEELLEDVEPPQEEVLQDFKAELGADQIVPVFIGEADKEFGVRPLLDALVKEAPDSSETAARRGLHAEAERPVAQVLKTFLSSQGGKLSLVRIWQGQLNDGMTLNEARIGGIYHLTGQQQKSTLQAEAGEIVVLSRMEPIKTGDTLTVAGKALSLPKANPLEPVFSLAIKPENRKDEVKLSGAIAKLIQEDPGLSWEHRDATHEMILWGQGDIHLQIAKDRLGRKFNLPVSTNTPHVPYKESIRKAAHSHGRYKHQTGGHGQFGDVHLDIQPQSRGEGFRFQEKIVGGSVPRQYIPGVETGVREFLRQGTLGFPVVDVSVTLTDGAYHSVDSSEQAFKQAARIAMQSGLANCDPVLLEPIERVTLSTPASLTSKVLGVITHHRGQILGYEPKKDWSGWDEISAYLPMAEMQTLIIELRSQTQGVGFFNWQDDHLEIVPDKVAERVLTQVETAPAA
ncbi:Elongation factor G [Acaryochloris thomasi RCC1774]|uniref:Elongation factor G n=1 Tax=Acaryochloris thomasi RCC1774 TaxID=1764569 RepID=A0A2W1JMN8_9CYAN|nr:elongation factor G [Acaryochloris thomasi]PZD74476.1 Elongation factor G [Acaryochloris thomasi RCC1774]